ncbi:MAG: response regulator transcription factor [Clostridia bacterium]|nr:response regulator transcription factor [Clostridia bacterium]
MIAIVEDDSNIRELVCYALSKNGLEAVGFENGQQLYKFIENQIPEVLLLDIMLPGEDGITILKKIKSNHDTAKVPVIMLTAKGTEYDKVYGLDCGADDYVTKPFSMLELVSRVKAMLRRFETNEDGVCYTVGELKLDDKSHTVIVKDKSVDLTLKEYNILKLLLKNKGKVITRDILLKNVWGYNFVGESRTVDVHMRTLRSKLGECSGVIETIRGVGYKIGGVK